ncbi:MAG: glycosyltransferase family 39 protein [Actinomycetaceae bacterium]|nr:glycosyltransferase family 39 protein [Actinomycetaceae bacterium]
MNKLSKIVASTKWDAVIPCIAFAVYFWISLHLYPRMAPDEYLRLTIPFFISDNNALPLGPEPEIVNPIWGFSYAYTAYGPSMLSAVFVEIASWFTTNASVLIVAARLTSVVSGALTVFLAMRIARRLFQNPASSILLGTLVAFTPQFAFMSSYHNNDIPSACAVTILILAWLRGIQDGWDTKNAALLGLGLGACSVTYYFGYGFILASIPLFFVSIFHSRGKVKIDKRKIWGLVGVVFVVALATGGWYFIRNGIIFDGDVIGMSTRDVLAEQMAQEEYKPSKHLTPQREGWSVWHMIFGDYNGFGWWEYTSQSLVGFFGYMEISLSSSMYLGYALLVPFLLIGIFSFRRVTMERGKLLLHSAMLFGLFMAVAFTVYYSWASDYEPQGRYVYSAFVVLALYAVLGMETIGTLVASFVSRFVYMGQSAGHAKDIGRRRLVTHGASVELLVAACLYILAFAYVWKNWLGQCLTGVVPPDSLVPFFQ